MKPDRCPLCLRDDQEIQDSHYLPRAAYRISRAEDLKNPNPVVMSSTRSSSQSSYQVHDFVFCWDCEQLLSREGENWVIPQLASEAGFPLLTILHSTTPKILDEEDLKVYACGEITGIDCDKLTHFGIGLFWKGHAHQWPTCERLDLGTFGEPIRKFLRGEGGLPEHVALFIQVADSAEPPWSARLPNLARTQPCHLFNFYLSGIDFSLAVGRRIPDYWRSGCFCHNSMRPLIVGAHVGVDELATLKRMMQKSRPSQKLTQFLKGPNPRIRK